MLMLNIDYWRPSVANIDNILTCWQLQVPANTEYIECWPGVAAPYPLRSSDFERFCPFWAPWGHLGAILLCFGSKYSQYCSRYWPRSGSFPRLANIDNILNVEPRQPLQILQYIACWQPLATVESIYSIYSEVLSVDGKAPPPISISNQVIVSD